MPPRLKDRAVRGEDVNLHLRRGGDAEPAGLDVEHVELGAIAFVHIDRRARQRAQLRRPGHVIDVAVSNDDGLRFELIAVENSCDLGNVVAGIDNNRFMRFLVAEDRAITVSGPTGSTTCSMGVSLWYPLVRIWTCVFGCCSLGL